MIQAGKIVLFRFPQTDLTPGKLRPALLIGMLPGKYADWMICMISSQLDQAVEGFDEVVLITDDDFERSGLKDASVIRIGRIAVVDQAILIGTLGNISVDRLSRIRQQLANWLLQA